MREKPSASSPVQSIVLSAPGLALDEVGEADAEIEEQLSLSRRELARRQDHLEERVREMLLPELR
ncbi:MAG TPA: hypothetical protein VFH61_14295 [Thermoleophilia bacterium]|nr:hypothetical protein [Thermoleophilia bacterium]